MNTKPLLFFLITAALVLPANWCSAATLPQEPSKARDPGSPPQGLSAPDWTSIRAAHDAWRHVFRPQADGTHTARNHAQQWRMTFDGRGFTAQPMDSGWQWGLELIEYAVGGEQRAVDGQQEVRAQDNRLSVTHDATLEEWFINDGRGLEQGWTFHERPAADDGENETLRLTLAVRGGLQAQGEGAAVSFTDENGASVLTYGGLKAWDADGKTLPARMTTATHAAATENGKRKTENALTVEVDARGARYPVTIDPIAQQAYLKPAAVGTTQVFDQFGRSVAISGDTVVVGAPLEDSNSTGIDSIPNDDGTANDSGAVYVFVRQGTSWSQQAYLKPAAVGSTQAGDQFGIAVAVSGDTIIVGANGEDSGSTGINSSPNESELSSGAAYIFARRGSKWSQQAYLKPASVGATQSSDQFGASVGIWGDTAIVGAPYENSSSTGINSSPNENSVASGAAYIFQRGGAKWTQQAYLKPAAFGTTMAADQFGTSVGIAGDTVVVGAPFEDSSTTDVNSIPNENSNDSGAVFIFVKNGSTWSQQAYLKPTLIGTIQANDNFGYSVAISADTVVAGSPGESSSSLGINGVPNENASFSGAASIFVRTGTTWRQQAYLKPAAVGSTQTGDTFGHTVAIAGDLVAVGAIGESSSSTGINSIPNESAFQAGSAYVFVRNAATWSQQAYLKPALIGSTQLGDQFGFSVAASGNTVVAGAPYEDGSSTGVNSAANENASSSGAVSIFRGLGMVMTSLSRTSAPASGAADITFGAPGFASVSWVGNVLFDQTLRGAGAAGGRNRGIFSTLSPTGTVDLVFQNVSSMGGIGGYAPGSQARLFSPPLCNYGFEGLFLAAVSGSGVSATNNRALLKDDGRLLSLIRRTGQPVAELGGAEPSAFLEVLQNISINLIAIPSKLKKSSTPTPTVTAANDSALLILDHTGALKFAGLPREGDPAYGGGGVFGEVTGGAANGRNSTFQFRAMFIPDNGAPVQAIFQNTLNGTAPQRVITTGALAPGATPVTATFSSFPALSHNLGFTLLRATLKGTDASANEGLWLDNGLGLQKRVLKGDGLGGGVRIARILKFWPAGSGQIVVQVILTGTGVTSTNNAALLLCQSDGNYLTLLRTGDRAPGAGPATVLAIQAVEVNPLSGHYAVLGSLKGAKSGENQALWAGQTVAGNDTTLQHLRLPTLRLRKGDRYMSTETPLGTIRSLILKPAVDRTGAGGRGLAQVVGSSGHAVVYILTDGGVTELVRLQL